MLQPIRRIPAARQVARSLRRAWEQLRPLPLANYVSNTPDTGGATPLESYFPPTISTLAAASLSPQTAQSVLALLTKLSPTPETEGQDLFYQWAQARFGCNWRYADSTTVLMAASMLLRPKSFLEIGVRRGRSAAAVAMASPDCAIYGFDLWMEGYGGLDNPGPDFVRGELAAIGHTGELTLTSGDSARTVPAFLGERPDLFFDIINVDGDHSVMGAARDMANVLPRLKVGGIIVFDDISSAPHLQRVWRWFVKEDGRYRAWEFDEAGAGVAAAVRVGE
jgi:predicted O-methyltransferase YrrM